MRFEVVVNSAVERKDEETKQEFQRVLSEKIGEEEQRATQLYDEPGAVAGDVRSALARDTPKPVAAKKQLALPPTPNHFASKYRPRPLLLICSMAGVDSRAAPKGTADTTTPPVS
jgi:hypothetical protein